MSNSSSAQFTVTTPPPPPPSASISLNPTSGPAGTTVTVTGSNFAANSGITISYDGTTVTTTPGTITTSSTGSFSATFTVPASTAGSHTVSAKDAVSNSASAQYTVTPSISLSPTTGPTGTIVTIKGTGFAASSGITVTYSGASVTTTPGTISTNSTGGFTATFTVPASVAAPHTVVATDGSHTASKKFTVTPSISLSPTTGSVDTVVTIKGTGFATKSGITISYDGVSVATTPGTITTDYFGSFSATFTVPADSTAGPHTASAQDTSSNSASVQYTVTLG